MAKKNLIIVESPAKAKTIQKYLGKNFEIVASMGHVRDLPSWGLNVDIENNFNPTYKVMKGKEETVKKLKASAEKSGKVFLATDPDREGEAISWHLAHLLDLDLKNKNRVTFNEITENGVKIGMHSARTVDMDLVNAQQARRILDRLVGYKLSPFLSKKIFKGLSAGRVQSVAVRMIVDREDDIRKFIPKEYWSIEAQLLPKGQTKMFSAMFYGEKDGKKKEIENEKQANEILKNLKGKEFEVAKVKKGTRKKNPAPPFTTSTLQQEASRKLGFQAKRTMSVAQQLYEGVDVKDMGAVGLITYMRTDSLRVSEDAIKSVRDFIKGKYGKNYCPAVPRRFKSKANAQDGHEAIRPTMPELSPDKLAGTLTSDQKKLYKLIWERFTACQMSECIQKTTQADIIAGDYVFKSSGYTVEFDGYTVLYTEGTDEATENEKALPELKEKMPLKLKKLIPGQHFTEPPARYTEASLIKAMEENGIGRPSTYAATISTILAREYVIREQKILKPTELGEVVTKLLKERFQKIVNLKFTAEMETDLDKVEDGKQEWVKILEAFYEDFAKTLEKAKVEMGDEKIELESHKTDLKCDKCGKPMVVKRGKFGKFIACSGYPECKNILKSENKVGVKCPKCNEGDVIAKKSRKGTTFYGCNNYPTCDFVSWDEPTEEKCPQCHKILYLKRRKKGDKIYCNDKNCGYEKSI